MSFLFDTNAISETLRRRPNLGFVDWLDSLPPEYQFTSIVVVGELFAGAYHFDASAMNMISTSASGDMRAVPMVVRDGRGLGMSSR